MKLSKSLLFVFLYFLSIPLFADEQNTVLKVDKMTCVSCPYMVKKSLEKVDGVKSVSVSFDDKTARVVYDDTTATIAQMIKATTDLGFPSKVEE